MSPKRSIRRHLWTSVALLSISGGAMAQAPSTSPPPAGGWVPQTEQTSVNVPAQPTNTALPGGWVPQTVPSPTMAPTQPVSAAAPAAPPTTPPLPVAENCPAPGQPTPAAPIPPPPGQVTRPVETVAPVAEAAPAPDPIQPVGYQRKPLGFTGPSSIAGTNDVGDPDFQPIEDRWLEGFPSWDRYGKGHPCVDDYPFVEGHWWDPFNQNVLKGDYPILGQHTFLKLTAVSDTLLEFRQIPTSTTGFESTANPNQNENFGKPNQFSLQQNFSLSIDLFHGDGAFKPVDWRVKVLPIFNMNYLAVEELAVVNPDVRDGTTRGRTYFSLEEWFVEAKLLDLSPNYDFLSARIGSQPFVSDFRGFIFSDINRAVRLFGTEFANRDQFNIIYFDQLEKDTNSDLNTFSARHQQILIANYYHQDFIWPGYTAQASIHYDHDSPTFKFNRNDNLVRPDPDGVFQPHTVDVAYLGLAGDGHIDRINITDAFYWALGHDSLNPLANRAESISAQMAAIELSYDRDWARFRTSFFYASGDGNILNGHATGFDTIVDNPNFAGGEFSYWQRQAIPLQGVNLKNSFSLVPELRSDKSQGQANFVNPGLFLVNFGVDADLTPKVKLVNNLNLLWFDKTNVLEQFLNQGTINRFIGVDISTGVEYRPFLNNNAVVTLGVASLLPGQGFKEIYNSTETTVSPLVSVFLNLRLEY